MTATEAKALKQGDRVEFADPALRYAIPPTQGIVMWIIRGEEGSPPEYEIGISWEGTPAVSQDPETDFEFIQRIKPVAPVS